MNVISPVVVVVAAAAVSVVVVVTVIPTQGQALQTKYHNQKYLKQTANADCVQQFDKTIDRIISACPVLAKKHCIKIVR